MKNLVTFILLLTLHTAFAQSIPAAKEKAFAQHPLTFIENKGQVTDQYGNARHDIQYKTGSAGISVFIGNGQLHYQWSKAETKQKTPAKFSHHFLTQHQRDTSLSPGEGRGEVYTMYRLDMTLEGANPHAQAIPADKQTYYENYHTTALHSDNATVCTYNKITYKNIYPHIDWALYIKDNKLEYDFILNPGGNVNDIKIKYSGATDIAHIEGNIKVTTPLGDVREQKLYAYEQSTGKPINAKFTCQNNTLGFSLLTSPSLRGMKQPTIVIDPTLAWGTYYGGDGEDESYGVAYSNTGSVFITGRTSSVSNIATTGAYQTVFGGFEDAFLAKFTGATGNILWATYYGGSSQDNGYAVACDNAGNAYITGFTLSTNNIATTGAHETTYQGGWDAFLTKFDSSGSIQWGTYYGGGKTDWGWSLTTDAIGNIYMCGVTSSSNNISTPASYQDTIGGVDSTNNAFLAKFNGNGTLLWGTYFGGASYGNEAFGCTCDNAQNVYIVGAVEGSNIYTTPGSYQNIYGGGEFDCFIAKFDSACNLKWSTYFGGGGGEFAQGIKSDDSLNIYITGLTYSTNNIATLGAYQTTYGGGGNDAFLAKFNDTGTIQWATYYGGSGDDEGMGVAYDYNGDVYIAGFTNSTNNIATPGSFHNTYMGGIDDAYLAKFNTSGLLLWASYYGGSSGDGAYGVTGDNSGNIYMAGGTASTANIATAGTYQTTFTDSTDAFLVKFDTATTNVGIKTLAVKTLNLYPNPNNGSFTVIGEFANNLNKVSINILNEEGQVVYNSFASLQNGQLDKVINIQAPEGIYFMKVIAGNETKTIKFLIE